MSLVAVGLTSVVYILGWSINVMDVDSSQYASMTREMLERGDFLHFTDRGRDYLDKPPLLFWLSGISMKLFGDNNVAFRIPAFLATLLSLYSTYRLSKIYYSTRTSLIAVSILATTQAVFLINHDVRTDTNLMCWFIFSMWHLAAFLDQKKSINLVLAFSGIGLAMLSKGPIGLVAPALGVGAHLILKRDWKMVFNPSWVIGILITAIWLLPMCYGLYTQFDLQPEKVVNDQTGVSGLRFFFWTQSFGRITGESIWENDSGPFFLTHSTLWAFAPWSIFLVLGLWREIKLSYKHIVNNRVKKEYMVLFGFLLPFIALSSSRYQLPHYAFIVYPLGAILAAKYINLRFYRRLTNFSKVVYRIHSSLMVLILFFIYGITWYCFPVSQSATIFFGTVALFFFFYFGIVNGKKHRLLLVTICTAIAINVCMNSILYPEILHYQAGSEVGSRALTSGLKKNSLYSYQAETPYSMDFYSKSTVKWESNFDVLITQKNILVYLKESDYESFRKARPDLTLLGIVDSYPVSQLSIDFLNPATRYKTVSKRYLIRL